MRQGGITFTDWFPMASPPGKSGTYQLLVESHRCFAHWDGYSWGANLEDHGLIAHALGNLKFATHWRGLTRDARGSRFRVVAGRLYGLS